ncbi:Dimethylaniline monooxygenase N-oxide-forming 1 [Hondaea fermentalgiana]|uniref:Dimethylaniline monooxygenase N-oxide-forming 1 n=1 Tax=Hondaea fermentalgiana TaxID=2315210 RepID=A0A2R5G252_9STRA|nr:Dimethylaniline monooxygenase N-oxide-forming 1 [Hondaea fermentalgiana]|eukprot:GBG24615.1 Dimethylaniline monooxygenase N-oxide-forming 1 [Hondaea fermentalgiana]
MAAREKKQRIAMIGGGVQGVVSAKVYQECGFEVVLIERQDKLGGQWNDAYPGACSQVRCHQYSFPTFQWPEERQMDHPTAEEVSADTIRNCAKSSNQHLFKDATLDPGARDFQTLFSNDAKLCATLNVSARTTGSEKRGNFKSYNMLDLAKRVDQVINADT